MENPYSPPQADIAVRNVSREYGGIRRLHYFGLSMLLGIAQSVISVATTPIDTNGTMSCGVLFIFVILSLLLVYFRLKNIGMNPWWALGLVIPILNIFIGVRCLAFQEGYADTKKLDTAGRVIVGIILLGILALLALFAIAVAIS